MPTSSVPDRTRQISLINSLTEFEIEAAMDDCDLQGEAAFREKYGYGVPQKDWVIRSSNGKHYPAKAIVGIALGKLSDSSALRVNEFLKGFGEKESRERLTALGYELAKTAQSSTVVTPFNRASIEAAMDAFDVFEASPDQSSILQTYGKARDYWVRSTRNRNKLVYPSKPIAGFLLNKSGDKYYGGWTDKSHAAAKLHNAGFIIVDEGDKPIPPPKKYTYLMDGTDRIKLCALNYFIEPARESGAIEVSISAGDLATAIGLEDAFPVICLALGDEKLQQLAMVPPPTQSGPNSSSSTVFTYKLETQAEVNAMIELVNKSTLKATNLILYGPPGTGKTYHTAWEAVRLCVEDEVAETFRNDRAALMSKYRALVGEGRIEFVTFHQSFSYEEFVEGLRPVTSDGTEQRDGVGFRLEPTPGVFQRISKRAQNCARTKSEEGMVLLDDRNVHQMSLGEAGTRGGEAIFEEAIEDGFALFGFEDLDWTDPIFEDRDQILRACQERGNRQQEYTNQSGAVQMLDHFRNKVKRGDILIISKGNTQFRAIGEVIGEYEFHPRKEGNYSQRRAVRWLWIDRRGESVDKIYDTNFTQKTIYTLSKDRLQIHALQRLIGPQIMEGASDPEPFVLIIDEINRANISKVFGDLITMIEADKRLGCENEVKVRLPYSGTSFGVPANLHIIGTMNTADRSIALLDTALRRRFSFRELMPDPSALSKNVGGIDLRVSAVSTPLIFRLSSAVLPFWCMSTSSPGSPGRAHYEVMAVWA